MMSESTEWDDRRHAGKEWAKRRLVGLCSSALAGGTPHKDYLVKLGMPAERVFLGYDAVDNGYFAAETAKRQRPGAGSQKSEVGGRRSEVGGRRSEARGRNGLPEKYFLANARFVEKKNLLRLIEAYAKYCELAAAAGNRTTRPQDNATTGGQHSEIGGRMSVVSSSVVGGPVVPWFLVILGDGPLKADLCRLISALGLQHCVSLPGFKQYAELPLYYGLASAFVHASSTEQWGLVVNEAMASGLPVLVSNRCGCAQDLVKDGVNGFTFAPYNVEQLAQLMVQISAFQPVRLSAFGDASREIVSNWGPERFAAGLNQAVEMALRVPAPKATLLDRMLLKGLLAR
jgi:glycosyltransferase involved in cell wall biosynthesis